MTNPTPLIPTTALCNRCLTGNDTDGDGNCPVCAHWSDERAREQRDWVNLQSQSQ
jgi:hypothetical protein